MKVYSVSVNSQYKNNYSQSSKFNNIRINTNINEHANVNFKSNPISKIKNYFKYKQVQNHVDYISKEISKMKEKNQSILFRNLSMENLEGLQYGIKDFRTINFCHYFSFFT